MSHQRLVSVDSVDCDLLTTAMAILQTTRERMTPTPENTEWLARVAAVEAVLRRIIIDSMMQSEIAKASLAVQP